MTGIKFTNTKERKAATARNAVEQPRLPVNQLSRRVLPHAEPLCQAQSLLFRKLPLELRLLVWEHALQRPYTTIERWRAPCGNGYRGGGRDANCFPYRLRTAMTDRDLKKQERPLALLLCCRQTYSEALKVLYSSTKFVLAKPRDVHCFQEIACPEGLASVRALVIPLAKVRWRFYAREFVQEWNSAFCDLGKMASLQELDIWLDHREAGESVRGRRPWKEEDSSEAAEQNHRELFNLFAMAQVPNFTVHLTWIPEDLLQHDWSFKVSLHTFEESSRGISQFPYPVDDIYFLFH